MKNSPSSPSSPIFTPVISRIIIVLAILTVGLITLDLLVHHHSATTLLPEFGLFAWISLLGGAALILLAWCLSPLLSRKGDYYER